MRRRPAVIGLVLCGLLGCRRGPSDEERIQSAYWGYRDALKTGDTARLRTLVSAAKQKELSEPDAEAKLQMVATLMPAEVRIVKTSVSHPRASLDTSADMGGQTMTGTVQLVHESGAWRIEDEQWTMRIDASTWAPPASSLPLFPAGGPPPQAYAVLQGHQGAVSRLVFTADGRYLVSAGYSDFSLRSWRAADGEPISTMNTGTRVEDVAVLDGGTVLTTDVDQNVRSWALTDGSLGEARLVVREAGRALAVSADGLQLATAGFDAPLRLWELPSCRAVAELGGTLHQRVLRFADGGRELITAGKGNTYGRWTFARSWGGMGAPAWRETRQRIAKVSADGDIVSLDVSGDGSLIALGHTDSSIVVVERGSGRERFNVYVRDASTRAVAFSPDGTLLATAQQDGKVYLWDTQTGRQRAALDGHREAAVSVAFSPDGRTLATGGEDRRIVFWRGGEPAVRVALPAATAPPPAAAPRAPSEHKGKRNYLVDPFADYCDAAWQRKGEARCETTFERPHFAVRWGGVFWQDATIPESTGRYVLVIARAAGERVNPDGDQTGLPYLYGHFVNRADAHRFNGYMNADTMTLRGSSAEEWRVISGIFPIPPDTGAIRLMLQQADGGQAQNGSAARFDDVGVFVFESEGEAQTFAADY